MIILNKENFKKTVLIIGVVHGDEEQGEFFINEYLKNSPEKSSNRLIFIPRLNGQKTRVNENGVDINRNFPTKNWELSERNEYFSGPAPASEKQTRLLIEAVEEYKPDAIVAIHAPYAVVNFDGPALTLARKISQILGYPVQKDIGYPTPGSFGTWAGVERKIPTITVETEENVPPETLYPKFKNLFEYFLNVYA